MAGYLLLGADFLLLKTRDFSQSIDRDGFIGRADVPLIAVRIDFEGRNCQIFRPFELSQAVITR